MEHLWLLYLLPLGGIVIVGLYRLLKDENDTGTNLVLSAIHSNEEIPLRMAPLIFISTVRSPIYSEVLPDVKELLYDRRQYRRCAWETFPF